MSTPFTGLSRLTPGEPDGSTSKDHDVTVSSTYTASSSQRLVLTGSGTHVLNFAGITAAKAVQITYTTDGAPTATVGLRLNGAGTNSMSLSPGGFFMASLTDLSSISLVYTATCTIQVHLLG